MADGYAKLFSSILDSTIWGEDSDTRIVWMTLMAMANADGYVGASVPGISRRARVDLSKCEEAINRFLLPDKYSRTTDRDGRRLIKADGGFILVNYRKYRLMQSAEDRRDYQAEWARNNRRRLSTKSIQAEAEAEAYKDPPITPPKRRRGRPKVGSQCPFPDCWQPTDAHAKRAKESGLNLRDEADRFEAHHRAKGSLFACWNSAFTTWLMNAVKYRRERKGNGDLWDELDARRLEHLSKEIPDETA